PLPRKAQAPPNLAAPSPKISLIKRNVGAIFRQQHCDAADRRDRHHPKSWSSGIAGQLYKIRVDERGGTSENHLREADAERDTGKAHVSREQLRKQRRDHAKDSAVKDRSRKLHYHKVRQARRAREQRQQRISQQQETANRQQHHGLTTSAVGQSSDQPYPECGEQ